MLSLASSGKLKEEDKLTDEEVVKRGDVLGLVEKPPKPTNAFFCDQGRD